MTDQCAGALGQRMVEEYGRAGHFERRSRARARSTRRTGRAVGARSTRAHAGGCTWSEPTGGMFTWLRLPERVDTRALRPAATEAGVAYVPGRPFYVGGEGHDELRLSFSHLDEAQLEPPGGALAGVLERALEGAGPSGPSRPSCCSRGPSRTRARMSCASSKSP